MGGQKENNNSMRMFRPVISLFVTRNRRLILLSKIWLFLNSVKPITKSSENFRIPIPCLFLVQISSCGVIRNFYDFSKNKSFKIYLRPMLPPGSWFILIGGLYGHLYADWHTLIQIAWVYSFKDNFPYIFSHHNYVLHDRLSKHHFNHGQT